jgi:hypothetical protein
MIQYGWLYAMLALVAGGLGSREGNGVQAQEPRRPQLQCFNSSERPVEIFWLRAPEDRVFRGRLAPGGQATIETEIGHRFAVVDSLNAHEEIIECCVRVQCFRYVPSDPNGIPSFYSQRVFANGYPIVASEGVSPFALREAAHWIDQMLSHRPDIREAMIRSGSRLCIMAWNEYTTDLPEFAWLGSEAVADFSDIHPKDYWDARARGLGGSENDPLCSCGEENLLAYPGDPYASECVLLHEFAHNIHLRGLVNVDPTFDGRLKMIYEQAMEKGLWRGKYASVNHHEYFAEGVQSWFDNNRENDHDHNHVNSRSELIDYDPALATLCREVFGETSLAYTKPTMRLHGHLEGFDPSSSPPFRWPQRLELASRRILENAVKRSEPVP